MSASWKKNVSRAQMVFRRKAGLRKNCVFCFYFKVQNPGGEGESGKSSLSLRNQFPQRGQSSMDADVQSVFKVVAREVLLCLKKQSPAPCYSLWFV